MAESIDYYAIGLRGNWTDLIVHYVDRPFIFKRWLDRKHIECENGMVTSSDRAFSKDPQRSCEGCWLSYLGEASNNAKTLKQKRPARKVR